MKSVHEVIFLKLKYQSIQEKLECNERVFGYPSHDVDDGGLHEFALGKFSHKNDVSLRGFSHIRTCTQPAVIIRDFIAVFMSCPGAAFARKKEDCVNYLKEI